MFYLRFIHIPHLIYLSGRIYKDAEPGHSMFSEAQKWSKRFVKNSALLSGSAVTTELPEQWQCLGLVSINLFYLGLVFLLLLNN